MADFGADISGIAFIVGTLLLGVVVLGWARHAGVRGLEAPTVSGGGAYEVDPLVKADMYLARGWHAQARATLEEAVRHDPLREDARRKLASIA